ncbi:conserved protein, unknown function [Hepatocystis sp. ex Piliocolobus tephrosceles]|nr:conserved protein, unknown function [Hepatocystis sp. ex Piliocolobus tephrosceles]
MLKCDFPTILNSKKKQTFQIQKRFAYYRFHKRVGKGSWNKYVERYKLPRSIENTQRLIFNYEGTYSEKKLSCSWHWLLPKKLAEATTSDEVLNVWVYYRHKKKKAYHYMKVLKRLVDVGSCSTTDWRFKLITSRIENKINTFLNLPRICFYYGKLKATAQLETITKILINKLNIYLPNQLLLILKGYALCNLQDKYMFNNIRDILRTYTNCLTFNQISLIIESYAACLIHDYLYINILINEIIHRLDLCNNNNDNILIDGSSYVSNIVEENGHNIVEENGHNIIEENGHNIVEENGHNFVEENDNNCISSSHNENVNINMNITLANIQTNERNFLQYKQDQFNYYPTMKQLVDVAYFLSKLKFLNYVFFDYISIYIINLLQSEKNLLTPYIIEKAVISFCSLKINDIKLFEYILTHIGLYIYDYPPSVLCTIGYYLSNILPFYYSPVYKKFKKMIKYIADHINILNLDALTKYASFIHKGTMNKQLKNDLFFLINECVKNNNNNNNNNMMMSTSMDISTTTNNEYSNCKNFNYDVPTLVEKLSYYNCIDIKSFNILCKHLHQHIQLFEPSDFNKTTRALINIKKKKNFTDEHILNALARNVIQQHDIFHIIDYHQTVKLLIDLGLVKEIYKIYLIKYHNDLPFYGFKNLIIDYNKKLPKNVKKALNRYKKNTIYFSNKKIEQCYPLYKSIED